MESVIRAVVIYLFLMLVIRLGGKRTLYEATPFDFILMLIIGEFIQEALVNQDFSLTNAFIIIITLVFTDIAFSFFRKSKKVQKILDGVPVLIRGKLIESAMQKVRIDKDDILETARQDHGLERLGQIKYAILEMNGSISIIPEKE